MKSKEIDVLMDELHAYVRHPSPIVTTVEISIPKHIWEELLQKDPSLKKLEKSEQRR